MAKGSVGVFDMLVDISNKIRKNRKIQVFKADVKELTIGQGYVVQLLLDNGEMSMGELAAASGVKMPTMTENVKRLEKLGHVLRRHDITDRRKVYVGLSPRGKKTMGSHRKKHRLYFNMLWLAMTGEEKRVVKSILEKTLKIIKKFS